MTKGIKQVIALLHFSQSRECLRRYSREAVHRLPWLGSATRTLRLFSAQIRAIIAMLEIAARISAAPAGNLG